MSSTASFAVALVTLSWAPVGAFQPTSLNNKLHRPRASPLASGLLHDPAAIDAMVQAADAWAPSMALSLSTDGSLEGAWAQYLSLLESPDTALATKAVSAGLIIGAGDASAQVLESKLANKGEESDGEETAALDWARVGRWAAFGLLLQAPWNHFFYQVLDGALPPTADPFTSTTFIKVAIDQFGQAPIFTVQTFEGANALIFVYFAVIEGKGLAFAKQQISDELFQVLLKNWAVFLPATLINLAFLPNELRVLFLNGVFFFWTIFLSLTVNNKKE